MPEFVTVLKTTELFEILYPNEDLAIVGLFVIMGGFMLAAMMAKLLYMSDLTLRPAICTAIGGLLIGAILIGISNKEEKIIVGYEYKCLLTDETIVEQLIKDYEYIDNDESVYTFREKIK